MDFTTPDWQIAIAAFCVWLIEKIKGSGFGQAAGAKLNRIIAIIVAGLASIGINFEFNSTEGILTVTGLTAVGILTALIMWLKAFILQQLGWGGLKLVKAERSRPS
jgi:hypothetical protein